MAPDRRSAVAARICGAQARRQGFLRGQDRQLRRPSNANGQRRLRMPTATPGKTLERGIAIGKEALMRDRATLCEMTARLEWRHKCERVHRFFLGRLNGCAEIRRERKRNLPR